MSTRQNLGMRLIEQRRRRMAGANSAPNQPTISAGTLTSSGATLTGSAFSDPDVGDTHAASQWQVTTAADTGFASPVYNPGDDATNKTSLVWSGGSASTDYLARVRYKDNHGNYSAWATSASFTTAAAVSHTFADDFAGTDGATITSRAGTWGGGAGVGSWIFVSGATTKIKNNRAYGDFGVSQYHSAATVAANGVLRATVYRVGTSYGGALSIRLRRDEGADSDYQLVRTDTGWGLRKNVSGAFDVVAGSPTDLTDSWPIGEYRTLEMETTSTGVIGRIYANDGTTLLGTITSSDTSVSAAGYLAFSLDSTDVNGPHIDSLEFTPT